MSESREGLSGGQENQICEAIYSKKRLRIQQLPLCPSVCVGDDGELHHNAVVVRELQQMLSQHWKVLVQHFYREGNAIADFMASLARGRGLGEQLHQMPPISQQGIRAPEIVVFSVVHDFHLSSNSWLLVSKELSAGIVFTSSIAEVWNDLDELFYKVDGSRIYFLHREITSHLQVHCQIFLMNLLPSVNQAYSILVQEKSQRQHSSSVVGSDPISFHSAHMVQKKHFIRTYDHCKIKGHKKESCYRIISYPTNFKFTKKKANKVFGSVVNNISVNDPVSGNEMTSDVDVSSSQASVFSQAQYQ
ncbi:hypothetical protein PVK06_038085 [Gossypium arboreum]|uniref:RNase H type-1 domain-containing protein n=1 Tax=Gossypium arboreum TaxID=29729 RepID=A0ABR0MZB5_GOSAR|nr:hypothetical protein PVK06_038085 [Gossypium arboreum]